MFDSFVFRLALSQTRFHINCMIFKHFTKSP
jgi:hypothetical protein